MAEFLSRLSTLVFLTGGCAAIGVSAYAIYGLFFESFGFGLALVGVQVVLTVAVWMTSLGLRRLSNRLPASLRITFGSPSLRIA
jgi:hypothetical protein